MGVLFKHIPRRYLFALAFKKYNNPKNRQVETDHSISFDLNNYMVNYEDYMMDGWNWTIKSNDGIDTNHQSVYEDYYGAKYGSICFSHVGNYCTYTREFNTVDSWTIGCYFKLSIEAINTYYNNDNINYTNGITWTDGNGKKFELRLLNATNDTDILGVAVYYDSKSILSYPYGFRPDEWIHVALQFDYITEIDSLLTLYLDGVKVGTVNMKNFTPYHKLRDSDSDTTFLNNICIFKNVTFGWVQESYNGIIPFYIDDLFLCNTSLFEKDNNPKPNRRIFELYPPMEINKKYYFSSTKRKDGGASNFYKYSNSFMDKLQGGE